MSEKKLNDVMARVRPAWKPPQKAEADTLLEHGLLAILARNLSEVQAQKTLRALQAAYSDWNELRVSQVQEFQGRIQTKSQALQQQVAGDVKEFLQEVFQKNHGFDLEFLRTDSAAAAKFVQEHPFLGGGAAHYLLWIAQPDEPPVSPSTIRVLDRVGILKRTTSVKKAQEALAEILPKDRYRDFALRIGQVGETWCDSKKPLCWECALVVECPFGKRVEKDWKAQQKRLEIHRKKEEERRRKEEEKERKRAATEARRKAKELARIKQKQDRERERLETKKRREAEKLERQKAAVARKKAAAKQASAKKVAAKKAAAQKEAAKKVAAKKKTAKKKTAKKPAAKKPSKKKTASRANTGGAKKKTARKPTAKKPASKKKTSTSRKGPTTRKKTARKSGSRPSNRKTTSRR